MKETVYEILWCVNHVDVREMPDAVGFVMPFLVGVRGEARVMGVFPERMGIGYARQFEKGMSSLGLSGLASFYTTRVIHPKGTYVHVVEKNGRPLGLAEGRVSMVDGDACVHRCEVGRLYYEGLGA